MSSLPQTFTITRIVTENAATRTFIFDRTIPAEPGQFVMAWLPGVDEKPFSLAAANPAALTIAAVGPFSRAIHALREGDSLWLRGPLGRGFHLPEKMDGTLVLVGGGYGAAPLKFLAERAIARGIPVAAIIGARSAEQLLLVDKLATLGVTVIPTTEDGSAGRRGLVTDALRDMLAKSVTGLVCACGPAGMLHAVRAECASAGVPVQLSWEAHMRCGIGLCGSCETGNGWLTCLDGPVEG